MIKKSKSLLIIFVNIVLVLALLELTLSLIMYPLPTYVIRHNYPNDKVETTSGIVSASWTSNNLGFHDRDHKRGKLKNTSRILAVGDSFLDGPQNIPLPMHLENALESKFKAIDVINLSRPGIDPDSYSYLVDFGLNTFKPDVVLVFIFQGNDFRDMERFLDQKTSSSFFTRYPQKSIFSNLLPRTSILISDIPKKKFIHKFQEAPQDMRWGRQSPVRDLPSISSRISEFIEAKPEEIETFLTERLTPAEIEELTRYGVRVDLLSYMVGVGMEVKLTPKLRIKNKRPELTSVDVADMQVKAVTRLLSQMEQNSVARGAEFYTVLIPTSDIDPFSAEMFKRLGSYDDPLFAGVRKPQMKSLQKALETQGTNVIVLADGLAGVKDTYLKFDTHWTDKGAKLSAEIVAQALADNLH